MLSFVKGLVLGHSEEAANEQETSLATEPSDNFNSDDRNGSSMPGEETQIENRTDSLSSEPRSALSRSATQRPARQSTQPASAANTSKPQKLSREQALKLRNQFLSQYGSKLASAKGKDDLESDSSSESSSSSSESDSDSDSDAESSDDDGDMQDQTNLGSTQESAHFRRQGTNGRKRTSDIGSIQQPAKRRNVGNGTPVPLFSTPIQPSAPLDRSQILNTGASVSSTKPAFARPTSGYQNGFGQDRPSWSGTGSEAYSNRYARPSQALSSKRKSVGNVGQPDIAAKILQTLGKMSTPLEEVRSRRTPMWATPSLVTQSRNNKVFRLGQAPHDRREDTPMPSASLRPQPTIHSATYEPGSTIKQPHHRKQALVMQQKEGREYEHQQDGQPQQGERWRPQQEQQYPITFQSLKPMQRCDERRDRIGGASPGINLDDPTSNVPKRQRLSNESGPFSTFSSSTGQNQAPDRSQENTASSTRVQSGSDQARPISASANRFGSQYGTGPQAEQQQRRREVATQLVNKKFIFSSPSIVTSSANQAKILDSSTALQSKFDFSRPLDLATSQPKNPRAVKIAGTASFKSAPAPEIKSEAKKVEPSKPVVQSALFAKLAKMKDNMYKCKACWVKNLKTVEKCVSCEEPNPYFSSNSSTGAPGSASKKSVSWADGEADKGDSAAVKFTFGGAASDSSAAKPLFEHSESKSSSAAPFSFGVPAKDSGSSGAAAPFSFGATPGKETDKEADGASKPAFSFGGPAVNSDDKTKEDLAAKPAFSFGAKDSEEPKKGEEKPAGNVFGAAPSSSSFSFGQPAEKPSEKSEKPVDQTTDTASKPEAAAGSLFGGTKGSASAKSSGFQFGVPKPIEAKPVTTGSFSFGGAPEDQKKKDERPEALSAPTEFAFGAASDNKISATQPTEPEGTSSFAFGASSSADSGTKPAATDKKPAAQSPFVFGEPKKNTAEEKPPSSTLTFGAGSKSEPAAPAASNPFGAGAASGGETKPASAGFTFGAAKSTPTTGSITVDVGAVASAASPNPFGSSTTAAATPAGNTPSAPTPGFTFGAAPSGDSDKKAAPKGAFSQDAGLGGSSSSTFTFGSVGGTDKPAPQAPTSGSFTFGSSTSSTSTDATKSSGSGAVSAFAAAGPAPTFGAPQTAVPTTGGNVNSASSNPFGGSQQNAGAGGNSFAFGAASSAATPATSSGTSSMFGNANPTPAPAFGNPNTTPAVPSFGSAGAAPAFGNSGSGAAPAFGSANSTSTPAFGAAAQQPATTGMFGANNNGQNAAPASNPFGGPAPSSNPFGAPAMGGNTNPFGQQQQPPQGGAAAPFGQSATPGAFGQPASSPAAPFGMPKQSSTPQSGFGAFGGQPQPSLGMGGGGGGFSMGSGMAPKRSMKARRNLRAKRR